MTSLTEYPLTPIQITIRQCIHAYNGQLRRSEVAKLLRGSSSQRVEELQKSEFFGRLSTHKRKSILHHLDVMIQQGLLRLDNHERVVLNNRHES